ncbi:MAG: DNA translocase FtsK [Clostridia bacterium]|nr:DNA translocase FtsK [Clostridia bacterium]
MGGFVFVLGLALIVLFKFDNIGYMADNINMFFTGLFGEARILLPISCMYVGIASIISSKKKKVGAELLKGVLITALASATVYAFTVDRYDFWSNPGVFVNFAYKGAIIGNNYAGLLGGIVASLTNLCGGVIISKIILVTFTFFFILFFINLSLRDFFAIVYNIVITIVEFIANMFITVFTTDEEAIQRKELKLKEREKIKREKEIEKIHKEDLKRAENVVRNYANVQEEENGQIKLDLASESEIKQKQEKLKGLQDEFFKKQKEESEEKNVKEVLQLDHSMHEDDLEDYNFPPLSLLGDPAPSLKVVTKKQLDMIADKLEKTLLSFGVEAKVKNITRGPTVVRYELLPAPGVKVSKIVNLADDIALNLAAKAIRIEAPIPGKGTVGIEIPNEVKEAVYIKDVIASDKFNNAESKLTFALGKDTAGDVAIGDIAKMPHVLIAGATGSGKSVCINALLTSILYKAKPSDVKLILVDPKVVELSVYNGIPHLLIPVVTDPKKAAGALDWAVSEMEARYAKFAEYGVRDIKGYNKVIEREENGKKLPQIVIIIDELADLMMVAANDVEASICRIAQKARAAGMHLVVATQRPSVDIITGVIKANIPSRIAFTVSSQVDSRTILDQVGAETLLGKGDMLYFPTGEMKPQRMQGAFVSDAEVENIVTFIKGNSEVRYNEDIIEHIEKQGKVNKGMDDPEGEDEDDADALLDQAIDLVVDMGQASASMLQRRFRIGYSRAGRIIDQMEARGIVSGYEGSKPRQVLISKEEWEELKMTPGLPTNEESI